MKWITFLVASLFFLACGQSGDTADENKVTLINPSKANELLNDNSAIQLVDVRTEEEYSKGHINNSTLVNYRSADFESKIQKLDKEKPVIVYCARGGRSSKAAAWMKKLGFEKIYDVNGGYKYWQEFK